MEGAATGTASAPASTGTTSPTGSTVAPADAWSGSVRNDIGASEVSAAPGTSPPMWAMKAA